MVHTLNTTDRQGCTSISEIINDGNLIAQFQPIISMSRKTVCGIEGLSRYSNKMTNQILYPSALFDAASAEGLILELDRMCREKVLDAFLTLYNDYKDKLLFINIDPSILDMAVGSSFLLNQVQEHNIDPRNIVIEINETKVQGNLSLKKFTDTYRKYGFLIALDDVGTGASNLDRILLVKPDIIKIDMSLVRNIDSDYYKQGVFKSLVKLANETGALVIAEGVETLEEAITALKLGGHMMQGYFFATPQEISSKTFKNDKIDLVSLSFNEYKKMQMLSERHRNKRLTSMVNKAIRMLKNRRVYEYNAILSQILEAYSIVESAYVLDINGIQLSDSVCRFGDRQKENLIFYSSKTGTDHSMDGYYYPLVSFNLKKYITEPYISLTTGNLSNTVATTFISADGAKHILCIDFKSDGTEPDNDPVEIDPQQHNRISGISEIIEKMNEELYKDSLTSIYNRRYIEERLIIEVLNAINKKQQVSIIMADIDDFKVVNDTYGHLAGDMILRETAKVIENNIRSSTDWLARYGGEEFLIVLNNADKTVAYKVTEKIRKAVEQAVFELEGKTIKITASFGAHTVSSPISTSEQLISKADKNLYTAKHGGKNQTISDN
jgi:diguanylate cyclase (GGDEF)-like protein